ncbi:MAG: sugar phosphate nucleotidyltransferase [Deltaproteobacteria bacterium]
MKAVVMAGGSGTRLRPLTCGRPKPIVPVMNKPVMQYTIELLKKYKINDIAVTLQYLPEMIKDTFGDGRELGVKLEYFVEDIPLGTAGSVKNAEEFLNDTFIVISGDVLTDIDLESVIKFHKQKKSLATIVLKEVNVPLEYGVIVTEEDGKIRRFLEKPSWSEVFSNTVNTGIYILESQVLSYFKKGEAFDFSKDLFPLLMKNGINLYGYETKDYWCDIGDIQSYIQAHADILDKTVKVNIRQKERAKDIYIGDDTDIHPEAVISAPVVIGNNCKIGKGVKIEPYSVIGDNVVIYSQSSVKRSILWNSSMIGSKSNLSGSILCYRANLKSNVTVLEQAVIGDDTQLKDSVIVKPNVKIWPHKFIENGTVVSDNIIWGTKFSKTLFGKSGISGDVNVEITPEFASKIGTAFASILKTDSKICISSDESSYANMIKYSVMSGAISSGLEVFDLGQTVMPIARNLVSFLNLDGGIHIKANSESYSKVIIEFVDKNGIGISRAVEKKIENMFITGEFRRVEISKIKQANILTDYNYFYLQNLINTVNADKIKKSRFKIVVGETSRFVRYMISQICEELRCEMLYRPEYNEAVLEDMIGEVVGTNANMGMIMDGSAEKMIIIDDKGRVIKDDLYNALIQIISLKTSMTNSVVVPITSSNVMETLAVKYNAKFVRTKTSNQEIMHNTIRERNTKSNTGFYLLNFDAYASLVKVLDYMVTEELKLSSIMETVPDFYITQKEIECPWEAKGKVMRSLIQEKSDSQVELYEGVKIFHDRGWVLVLPDSDEPVCTVYSEGISPELAESLSNIYVDKIRNIITN